MSDEARRNNNDDDAVASSSSQSDQRKAVRQAERAPWNRLLSVLHDAAWVMHFCHSNVPQLPIVPNLRCGAWYVPPNDDQRTTCYFKSTDGHTNAWGFSLKRYNPAVLALIEQRDGCIIVDSTRRGKSMPDALSKTIPIWCAVINAAVAFKSVERQGQQQQRKSLAAATEAAATLRLPEHVVSPSERAQIAKRIDGWVDDLLDSDLHIPTLIKPLRPIFITRSHIDEQLQDITNGKGNAALPYYPVVLVSASPMVHVTPDVQAKQHAFSDDASLSAAFALSDDVQRLAQNAEFVYAQGSGDDEEMWSEKLTPQLLWNENNLRSILQTNGDAERLQTSIATIVLQAQLAAVSLNDVPSDSSYVNSDCEIGTFGIWFGRRAIEHEFDEAERTKYGLIVQADGVEKALPAVGARSDTERAARSEKTTCKILRLGIESGKRGLHSFRDILPEVIAAARNTLPRPILLCSAEANGIGHDLNGALAVCLLATCFDSERRLRAKNNDDAAIPSDLIKDDVQKRLQWITTLVPHAKPPSRKHMLRINDVLLSQSFRAAVKQ